MSAKVEDLMTDEAKDAFEKFINEHRERVARKAVIRALTEGRNRANETDVQQALEELTSKKYPRPVLLRQIGVFLVSLLAFEGIMIGVAFYIMNLYLLSSANNLEAIAILFGAAITSGGVIAGGFYQWVLRGYLSEEIHISK